MDYAIEVKSLTKFFGKVLALDNLSFRIRKGEIFGIVGPDGGGKTTLIRLLSGILSPTSGEISILGLNLHKNLDKLKPILGYLSQNFSHYLDLTVEENLEFFAEIHKVDNYKEKMEFLLEFAKLKHFRKELIANLSGGMKQKLALITSLIYDPEILLLDEPTNGVDPVSRREFWFLLNQLVARGKTFVFATPYLDEAERFHKVLMLNNGKMLCCDSPENIIDGFEYEVAEIICSNMIDLPKILSEIGEVQVFGDRINLIYPKQNLDMKEKIKNILEYYGIVIYKYDVIKPTMENVFFSYLKAGSQ
jgi:ABC-2 type transport system ATP-binding protein